MQYVMKTFSILDSKWVKYMQNVFNQKMNNKEFSFLVLIGDFLQFHKQSVPLLGSECVDS